MSYHNIVTGRQKLKTNNAKRWGINEATRTVICCLLVGLQWHPTPVFLPGKIPWTEEPGTLQSMGLLESDMTEQLHFYFSLSCTGEGNGNPLQCSCLENPRVGGAWWAAIYGVAQSQTWLKWLSSSSSGTAMVWPLWETVCICVGQVCPILWPYWSWCAIFLLHGIFPTQGLNPISCVSCTASGFFTC